MILDDSIELLDSNNNTIDTIPCRVGHRGVIDYDDRGANVTYDEAYLMIEPDPRAVIGRLYRWRGVIYMQFMRPTIRRQHGEDHHYSITLRQYFGA